MRGTGLESVIAFPAKYVMSIVGTAVSVGGFVALVTAGSVKAWVKSHPYPIYIALIVAIMILTGTLNYAYNLRKLRVQPTDHDTKLYGAALRSLPPNGPAIGWLKRVDMISRRTSDFPADVLAALEDSVEFARTRPVGFDDPRLAVAYETLTTAITGFCTAVENWTIATGSTGETAVTKALRSSHQALVQAYDGFLRTAHASGIDTDA